MLARVTGTVKGPGPVVFDSPGGPCYGLRRPTCCASTGGTTTMIPIDASASAPRSPTTARPSARLRAPPPPPRPPPTPRHSARRERLVLAGILCVTAVARLYRLDLTWFF